MIATNADRAELFEAIELERTYANLTNPPTDEKPAGELIRYQQVAEAGTVPQLDEVMARFTPKSVRWLLDRIDTKGYQDRLVIAPWLGLLTFEEFADLAQFGMSTNERYRMPKDVERHNQGKARDGFSVGIVLGDTEDPLGRPDVRAERGVVFLNRSHAKQSRDLWIERHLTRRRGIAVRPMTVMEFAHSGVRHDPLNTRFIHLGTPNIGSPGYGLSPARTIMTGLFLPGGNPGAVESYEAGSRLTPLTSAFARSKTTGVRRVMPLPSRN